MPLEALVSSGMAVPLEVCPKCGKPFEPFMRGQVTRSPWTFRRWWFRRRADIWALICWACKEIVGYEAIPLPPEDGGELYPEDPSDG